MLLTREDTFFDRLCNLDSSPSFSGMGKRCAEPHDCPTPSGGQARDAGSGWGNMKVLPADPGG